MNKYKGPDILGVCEVENKSVLNQLKENLSSLNRNYEIIHHNCSDGRGIDVAFIYDNNKFEFEEYFSHFILKRFATRDIFQVNMKFRKSGSSLILIGNHWPGRTSGEFKTEPFRIIAAETLSFWNSRILEEKGSDAAILVIGDFNDDPFNKSITHYALSSNNLLKVKNSSKKAPRLYNLMWPLMGNGLGTYYYNNFPHMFDQFLVSKEFINDNPSIRIKLNPMKNESYSEMLKKLKSGKAVPEVNIERYSEMIKKSKKGYELPRPYGRPYKNTLDQEGFSDHFPISLVLVEI